MKLRAKVKLDKWLTSAKPFRSSKEEYERLFADHVGRFSDRQRLHYASNRYALQLVFQGMDAAGKDGAIRHGMSGVNPQGCQVFSFKQPNAEELDHDFLWRTTCRLPERGRIGIFDRSYSEKVLVVRVHPELLQDERLPHRKHAGRHLWKHRLRSIVDLEKHLHRNGTRIVKIVLHVSRDEQRRRCLGRLDEPDKHWKFILADVHERAHWDHYMKAYEECLAATSTHHAPWYAVPAEDGECPIDRLADRARCARRAEDELPEADGETRAGVGGRSHGIGQVGRSRRPSRRRPITTEEKHVQIQINTDHTINGNETMAGATTDILAHALRRFSDHITRVEVHLADENGLKGGESDIRCTLEACLEGRQPIAATHHAGTIPLAVHGGASSLVSLIESTFGRREALQRAERS